MGFSYHFAWLCIALESFGYDQKSNEKQKTINKTENLVLNDFVIRVVTVLLNT